MGQGHSKNAEPKTHHMLQMYIYRLTDVNILVYVKTGIWNDQNNYAICALDICCVNCVKERMVIPCLFYMQKNYTLKS